MTCIARLHVENRQFALRHIGGVYSMLVKVASKIVPILALFLTSIAFTFSLNKCNI